jgi:hypothetical protein
VRLTHQHDNGVNFTPARISRIIPRRHSSRHHAKHLRCHKGEIQDAIWDAFAEGYYQAYQLYEDDKLNECIKECFDFLKEEASIPRYIRISTLILLALVVKEEVDFCAARSEAGMVLCVP